MTRHADPDSNLEQQLAYRVAACLADARTTDPTFTLPGLRGWMLCQRWPEAALSARLECLAVLTWSAICSIDADPDQEPSVLKELAWQIEYLGGVRALRPASLDAFQSVQARRDLYGSLRKAAEPGLSRREFFGLPRFDTVAKAP
jgi:hypothetical protein